MVWPQIINGPSLIQTYRRHLRIKFAYWMIPYLTYVVHTFHILVKTPWFRFHGFIHNRWGLPWWNPLWPFRKCIVRMLMMNYSALTIYTAVFSLKPIDITCTKVKTCFWCDFSKPCYFMLNFATMKHHALHDNLLHIDHSCSNTGTLVNRTVKKKLYN